MNREEFEETWLPQTMTQYKSLSPEQKTKFMSELLQSLGHTEKYLLQSALPQLLFRDFVKLLPLEILEKIFDYLTVQDLLHCCSVSKHWNKYLNSQASLWKNQAKFLGLNLSIDENYKLAVMSGLKLRHQLHKSQCFKHILKENLIKPGTWFSALSQDKGYIAAATCDPSNVNRNWSSEDDFERVFIFKQDLTVEQVFDVPMFVSVVKLVYPDLVITGHFDGNISCYDISTSQLDRIRGHSSDVLSLDINQVMTPFISYHIEFIKLHHLYCK